MKPAVPRLRHPKLKGEWAEVSFVRKAMGLGFAVCRPFGDTEPFDFLVVAPDRKVSRVQVKSCWTMHKRAYFLNTHRTCLLRYRARDLDFIIAFVVPEDAWYVIPMPRRVPRMLAVFPHVAHSRGRYEKYRDAWHLLRSRS